MSEPIANHVRRFLRNEISTGKLLELVSSPHDLCGAFGQVFDESKITENKKLHWSDLNVNAGSRQIQDWRNRKGELRVHVSVRGIAFVMHTFWFKDWTPEKPETQAAILLVMNKHLTEQIREIKEWMI
jgi:hypothetical protein